MAALQGSPSDGPDPGPDPEGDGVGRLRTAVLVLGRRLRHQASGDALSATEMAVFGRVHRDGPLTPGQLARAEHVQPPSMTRIVERLVSGGYLERNPHPDDGRQHLLSVSEVGAKFIEETRFRRTQWLAAHLDQLSESDRSTIHAALPALQRLADLP